MNRRELILATTAVGGAFAAGWATKPLASGAEPTSEPNAASTVAAQRNPNAAEILMLVYPKFTALDLVGPQHVFSLLGPEFKTQLVWKDTKEVVSDTGIPIRPTKTFAECVKDPVVIFVPGGTDGTIAAMEDKDVREFLASRGAKATYVTSVCTGSLVLRVVVDRNRVTGAGVTAGIDFAITLTAKLKDEKYAKAIQLMSEYDPQPPYPKDGSPKTADKENLELLKAMTIPFNQNLEAVAKRLAK